jgi:hypothetical protein
MKPPEKLSGRLTIDSQPLAPFDASSTVVASCDVLVHRWIGQMKIKVYQPTLSKALGFALLWHPPPKNEP